MAGILSAAAPPRVGALCAPERVVEQPSRHLKLESGLHVLQQTPRRIPLAGRELEGGALHGRQPQCAERFIRGLAGRDARLHGGLQLRVAQGVDSAAEGVDEEAARLAGYVEGVVPGGRRPGAVGVASERLQASVTARRARALDSMALHEEGGAGMDEAALMQATAPTPHSRPACANRLVGVGYACAVGRAATLRVWRLTSSRHAYAAFTRAAAAVVSAPSPLSELAATSGCTRRMMER